MRQYVSVNHLFKQYFIDSNCGRKLTPGAWVPHVSLWNYENTKLQRYGTQEFLGVDNIWPLHVSLSKKKNEEYLYTAKTQTLLIETENKNKNRKQIWKNLCFSSELCSLLSFLWASTGKLQQWAYKDWKKVHSSPSSASQSRT